MDHLFGFEDWSLNESKKTVKRRYTENYPAKNMYSGARVRKAIFDAVGDVARLPGDIALSTPIGQEIAEASAPIVAGAAELVGPALMWGKLMMAAGGTTLRASLAGARAATEAVVVASQERALQSRESDVDTGVYNSYRG